MAESRGKKEDIRLKDEFSRIFREGTANVSHATTKARREGGPLPASFGGRVAEILEATKYRRRWSGRIAGYGTKWLP